jgi:multidrug efflux pump subunit AcrB
MAFFGGSTGVIYRQFSITIVSAMALSVFVALTLTPALCATLLKPVPRAARGAAPRLGAVDRFFAASTAASTRAPTATRASWAASCGAASAAWWCTC